MRKVRLRERKYLSKVTGPAVLLAERRLISLPCWLPDLAVLGLREQEKDGLESGRGRSLPYLSV